MQEAGILKFHKVSKRPFTGEDKDIIITYNKKKAHVVSPSWAITRSNSLAATRRYEDTTYCVSLQPLAALVFTPPQPDGGTL